jgi:hypothetical protein
MARTTLATGSAPSNRALTQRMPPSAKWRRTVSSRTAIEAMCDLPTPPSPLRTITCHRTSSEGHQSVIRESSEGHQRAIGWPSKSHQSVNRVSSEGHQRVLRELIAHEDAHCGFPACDCVDEPRIHPHTLHVACAVKRGRLVWHIRAHWSMVIE